MADQADKIPESLPVTSSVPAELPEKQEALAREVLVALERQRIPYAVAGAHALLEHTGICRTTKDLDLFLTSENGMSNAVFSVDDSSIRNCNRHPCSASQLGCWPRRNCSCRSCL